MSAIITIRPAPGDAASVEAGRKQGLEILSFPLSEILPLEWQCPDPAGIDALLIGSANAIRHGGANLKRLRAKPVMAVGLATAAVARKAGFRVELAGQAGLQSVLARIPRRPARLLRIAGKRHVPLDLPEGVEVETRVAYESRDLAMPDALREHLRGDALVLLHSAGAAEHLRSECERLGLNLSRISIAALGPRIAAAAGDGWKSLRASAKPEESALLALAADMCH